MNYSPSESPPPVRAFARTLAGLMQRLEVALLARERNALALGELTLPQMTAIDHIESGGPCTMSALAGAFQMNPSTATGLADRLTAMGLTRRNRDAGDRRAVVIRVTPKGRRIVEAFRRERQKTMEVMFREMSARRRDNLLAAVLHAVKAMEPAAAGGRKP